MIQEEKRRLTMNGSGNLSAFLTVLSG